MELEYIGVAPGIRTWPGIVTCVKYKFGSGVVRYVDKRDALKWLAARGDGKAFALWRGE